MGKVKVEENARKFIKQDDVHEAQHDKNLYNTIIKRTHHGSTKENRKEDGPYVIFK